MGKQKDIDKNFEKKLEKENIEKIKPEKEIKIEKREGKEFKEPYKEHKEKPEKREIKEWKDKPEKFEQKEKREIKEIAKIEIKEFRDVVKDFSTEGPGKELVEGPGNPGDIFEKPQFDTRSADLADTGGADAAKVSDKIADKPLKEFAKEIEKIKREKEFAKVEHKEFTKHEKYEIKEKPEKEKVEKIEKPEKWEKEFGKREIKEVAKIEIKEFTDTVKDFSTEGPGKELVEGPENPGDIRTNPFKGSGPAEERLKELEDAVTRLSHFIGVDLRPDLSGGALSKEPDVKKDDKAKPKEGGAPPTEEKKR
jgi:hypothetical protein